MTDKFFYVDGATFDTNYNGVILDLICSPENIKDLFRIIESSQGKIVISAYKNPENLAQKCKKETTDAIIKHLYNEIEKAVENTYYKYATYLNDASLNTIEEITSEFTSKGFDVYFDEVSNFIKISWK